MNEKKPIEKFPGIRNSIKAVTAAVKLADTRLSIAAVRVLKAEVLHLLCLQNSNKEEVVTVLTEENNRLHYHVNELKDEIEILKKEILANKEYATWYIRLSDECKKRIHDGINNGPAWKISAIRELRSLLNTGLADSKCYAEKMEANHLSISECGGDWFKLAVDEAAFNKNMENWKSAIGHKMWEMFVVTTEAPASGTYVDATSWTYKG